MDSAFARYYRTLGQFYEPRLVHGSLTPGVDPARNDGANSVFTDNGPGCGTMGRARARARGKYRAHKFSVIYERPLANPAGSRGSGRRTGPHFDRE